MTITGNLMTGNAAGSAIFSGKVMAPNFQWNLVDTPPVESVVGSLMDFSGKTRAALGGFQPANGPQRVEYPTYYAEIGAMPMETKAVQLPQPDPPSPAKSLNVRNFGALGDGVTNDTAAFARAIAALPAAGGTLEIPAGNYLLQPVPGNDKPDWTCVRHDLAIMDRTNVHLLGKGGPQLIFTDADAQGLRLIHCDDCSISGITFRLRTQPPLRHDRALIDLSACTGISLEGLEVDDSSGPGINVDSSRVVTIEHCRVGNAGTNGVAILSSSQVLVENCTLSDSRDCAVRIDQTGSVTRRPQFVRIDHNRIEGVREGFGIAVCTGDEIEAGGNQIADTYQAGIAIFQQEGFLPPPRSVVIAGNTLSRCNTGPDGYTSGAISVFAVRTDGGGDFQFTGNTIESTPQYAISIERAGKLDHVTIQGNTVRNAKLGATEIAAAQKSAIKSLALTP
jgi:putative cofactor-binding repeat protein